MKEWLRRWLPYAVIGLLVFVLVRQHTTIQNLQGLNALRSEKIDNTFRYMAEHASESPLPATLDQLRAAPSADLFWKAQDQTEALTDELLQLNNLADGPVPTGGAQSGNESFSGGFSTGGSTYRPLSPAQDELGFLIEQARLWPSLWSLRIRFWQNHDTLRPVDRQFLQDAAVQIRLINQALVRVRGDIQPHIASTAMARGELAQVKPVLLQLQHLIESYKPNLVP